MSICPQCNKDIPGGSSNFNEHTKKHKENSTYDCKAGGCDKKFKSKIDYILHMSKHKVKGQATPKVQAGLQDPYAAQYPAGSDPYAAQYPAGSDPYAQYPAGSDPYAQYPAGSDPYAAQYPAG